MQASNVSGGWLASKERTEPWRGIVLHASDGFATSGSIEHLRKVGFSYHYIIERDGRIIKLVPLSKIAFHAGVSRSYLGKDCNHYTIGICFANYESGKEPIKPAQLKSAAWLVSELKKAYPGIAMLTTHYAVSPGRKTDPAMLAREWMDDVAEANDVVVWLPPKKGKA